MTEVDAQPAGDGESQGDATTDSGLYDLDSVAPEVRELLEPHIKAMNGNVEKKFREAADYRKGWAPYEETGIKDLDPDSLKGLLEFAQMANDPEQFSQWWKKAGEEQDLFEKFNPSEEDDLDLGLEDDLSPEKVQELIEKQVAERIGPIEQTLQQQEQQSKADTATKEVADAMTAIRRDNAALFEGDEEQQNSVEQRIARLAYSYSDESSLSPEEMIQKGFEDYKDMIGAGEKGLFQQKANQPKPPEGAGGADTSPEKLSNEWNDPARKAIALQRLKQAQG